MEQYTAGQLAELSGVSARTIRYYHQRGLLQPAGYTESGYRLYNKDALVVLQRILMLKFAGFSLEEIQGTMLMDENSSILDILEDQRQMMIQKRDQIDEIIRLLNDIGEHESQDMESLVELMRRLKSANHSGRTYGFLNKYGKQKLYPYEFSVLDLEKDMRVLDAGCGYGMLWRLNWEKIPENTEVTMVDILPGVLGQFRDFYQQNDGLLHDGACFIPVEGDMEALPIEGCYDRIVMAYLKEEIKDQETMLRRFYDALNHGGFLMAVQGSGEIMKEYDDLYHEFSGEYCLKQRYSSGLKKQKAFEEKLEKQFDRVERIVFENEIEFDRAVELYRFLMDSYKELIAELKAQGICFINFLRKYMAQQGSVKFHSKVLIYRCWKEEKEC